MLTGKKMQAGDVSSTSSDNVRFPPVSIGSRVSMTRSRHLATYIHAPPLSPRARRITHVCSEGFGGRGLGTRRGGGAVFHGLNLPAIVPNHLVEPTPKRTVPSRRPLLSPPTPLHRRGARPLPTPPSMPRRAEAQGGPRRPTAVLAHDPPPLCGFLQARVDLTTQSEEWFNLNLDPPALKSNP
jgi:hypothetical protein